MKSFDETAFDSITPESAYFVGLLMADGWVITDRRYGSKCVGLALCEKDGGHVETFKRFLKSDHKITRVAPRIARGPHGTLVKSTGSLRFVIWSRRLAEAVERFGVVENKTKRAKVIGLEKNRDFWRGVTDGDGTVSIHTIGQYRRPFFQLLGSELLMTQFLAYAKTVAPGWDGKVEDCKRSSIHLVRTTGDSAATIIRELYQGCSVALPRKMAIAEEVLQLDADIVRDRQRRAAIVEEHSKCKVEGCGRKTKANRLCGMHLHRWERKGRLERDRKVLSLYTRAQLLKLFAKYGKWVCVARHLGLHRMCLQKVRARLGIQDGLLKDWSSITRNLTSSKVRKLIAEHGNRKAAAVSLGLPEHVLRTWCKRHS